MYIYCCQGPPNDGGTHDPCPKRRGSHVRSIKKHKRIYYTQWLQSIYGKDYNLYCRCRVVSTETGIDYDDGSLTTAQTHYNVYVSVWVYKIRLNNYK